VPFVLSRSADADEAQTGPLVNGRVDLVYEDDGQLVVVDYKTDKGITKATAKQHTLDKHSGQAEAYRDGLGGATGMKVREVAFVYCRAGTEVRLGDGDAVTEAIT
jgi:ATP-dependent helicase/nuclease subunit A